MKKRGKLRNKCGITNIEMSVAIILFVAAVFSIILIFNLYYKPDKINSSVLDDFEKNFLDYANDFTKVGVYVDPSSVPSSVTCFNISFNNNLDKNNLGVFFDNTQISSSLNGDYLAFDKKLGNFYEIYEFSFPISNNPIYGCNSVSYNYTIPVQAKIFLIDKLNQTASSFSNTNIVVKDESGGIIFNSNKVAPKGAEVLAKTFFILVYDNISDPNNPKIKNCQVNVRVW